MLRNGMIILMCLLLLASGCQSSSEEVPDSEETASEEAVVSENQETDEVYGQIPYVSDMLDAWLISLKNDDLETGLGYFAEDCEGRLLGDSVSKVRERSFWRSYLSNLMNLYVDATLEVESVEVNGRGTKGEVIFLMEIEGRKSGDDFERRISAEVVFIDGGWKFSRYEELGDKI